MIAVNSATAQTCYRLTELKALGFTPFPDDIFGMNNLGEVAFAAMVNGDRHAFIWLPQPNYNLADGLHDLHVLANLGPNFTASKAHDISAIGIVAGQATTTQGETRAFVWKLGPPVVTIDLTTYTSPAEIDFPSDAWAVSDAAQPVVVGEAQVPIPGCELQILGFRTTLDSNFLTVLPPIGGLDDTSAGRDVNNASEPFIVGMSHLPCLFETPPCTPDLDAVRWEPAVTALVDLGVQHGAEARGNNDNRQIVGYGFRQPDLACLSSALFWEPPLFEPFNLGGLPDVIAFQTRAEAINNLLQPQVVGWNETELVGLIWENQGGTNWSVTDLNTVIDPCSDDWKIIQAHDINDSSRIIAWADDLSIAGLQPHAVLLTPLAQCPPGCEADLDNDGVVGILDLLNLLAAWGPCPDPPESCFADLNCDGSVGILDLLALLAAWGKCPGVAGPPPKSLKRELEDAGLSEDDWDLFEECLTNGTPEEQDNCRCWFDRYMNGCPADCSQLPACGDVDPFNECPGDFTGPLGVPDCRVDAFDLARLLSCWGMPCGDLTGDCTTDPFDLAKLNANWGPCLQAPLCGPGPELSCNQGAQGGGGSHHNGSGDDPSLTAALDEMGFDSVEEYQDWLTDASDSEAFESASLLQALLEAQP